MWPGQQPPGGEQNPQDQNQNPYQQPGYSATPPPGGPPPPPGQPPTPPPGGYQQPGYQQPPTQPGYGYPASAPTPPPGGFGQQAPYQQAPYTVPMQAGPPGPGGSPDGDRKKTIITASIAGVVVVAALAVTGIFVLGDKDEKPAPPVAAPKTTQPAAGGDSAPATSDPSAPAPGAGGTANPRAGIDAKPTIPGWKVVINPKHGTVFDVPPEWDVQSTSTLLGFEDAKNPTGPPVAIMSAPATLKEQWCVTDEDNDGDQDKTALSHVGTTGGIKGAKDTAEVAQGQAGNWVFGGYDQKRTGKINVTKGKPFTTTAGVEGSISVGTAVGVKKANKCSSDGKSLAFGFKNAKGDFKTWVFHSAKGVKDEVSDATVMKILGTLRLAG
ncbi:hypothetical protein ACIO3O_33775 [Streptomyces sp. NPDC087440]|uniref:hypothetical protein n=1 Tax=Streptomyces sp. NPDC087440 TaxID=3365790 RepID=UPI0038284A1D